MSVTVGHSVTNHPFFYASMTSLSALPSQMLEYGNDPVLVRSSNATGFKPKRSIGDGSYGRLTQPLQVLGNPFFPNIAFVPGFLFGFDMLGFEIAIVPPV